MTMDICLRQGTCDRCRYRRRCDGEGIAVDGDRRLYNGEVR